MDDRFFSGKFRTGVFSGAKLSCCLGDSVKITALAVRYCGRVIYSPRIAKSALSGFDLFTALTF